MSGLVPVDSRSAPVSNLVALAFESWASEYPAVPQPARQFIRSVNATEETLAFLTTEIEGRRLKWIRVPYQGTSRVQAARVREGDVDPWTADAGTLRVQSDYVDICDECGGAGKG